MEQWKEVEGASDYLVSNYGRMKRKGSDRIMKCGPDNWGRPKAAIRTDNGWRHIKVHKLVAKAFVPGYRPGLEICHLDGDLANNYATNLKWVTHQENYDHSLVLGSRRGRPQLRRWIGRE